MTTFVVVLHVLVSLLLVLTVLLQPGNKGGMGAAFGGGGGGTVFGGRGANTFLAKLTAGSAFVFMLTSFSLVYLSSRETSAFDRSAAAAVPDTAPENTSAGDAAAPAGDAPAEAAPSGDATASDAESATAAPAAAPANAPAPAAADAPAPAPANAPAP